jgi:hypothetical protein
MGFDFTDCRLPTQKGSQDRPDYFLAIRRSVPTPGEQLLQDHDGDSPFRNINGGRLPRWRTLQLVQLQTRFDPGPGLLWSDSVRWFECQGAGRPAAQTRSAMDIARYFLAAGRMG